MYGIVRLFGGKRNVIVFKMVLVMDMNEVIYYMLEVIYSYLVLFKYVVSVCFFVFFIFGGLIKLNFLF